MLQKIDPKTLTMNPFTLIGDQWLLITAGTPEHCNTMTASWGGVGVMWAEPSATCYIRPQRYTKEFVDKYIDKIYATMEGDHTLHLQIKIFTGETTDKYLSNLKSRTGHTFKKMIEAYERSMK